MKKGDKLYKQMIKSKNKQQKLIKHNSHKKYGNKLIELRKLSKQSYYQKYFKENKKSSKKTWEGIDEIISSRKAEKDGSVSATIADGTIMTDPTKTAESFNNFFTSIGANLRRFHKLEKVYRFFQRTKS